MHDAMLWEPLENGRVHCRLCPWLCNINPGKRGVCGVRVNDDGALKTLIYGEVSSAAVDPIEKKPLYHFYPGSNVFSLGTFGCNMQCKHCQNWQISHVKPEVEDGRLSFMSPERAIELTIENNCQGIAWTYNEPTIWFEYAYDTAKLAKKKGLYTVFVTNGYIELEALDTIGPYLDAFRVDIKAFTNEHYKELANIADLQPILDAAVHSKTRWNMHVEYVTNVIPTFNDSEEELTAIASWIYQELGPETPWHVTRFHPYYKMSHLPSTPIETLEMARKIGIDAGLNYVYLGNVPGHPGENTYCPGCGDIVIERQGFGIIDNELNGNVHEKCGAVIPIVRSDRPANNIERANE